MSRNYYYLVAGLPDLVIDAARAGAPYAETVAELAGQMHPDDADLARLVRLPFDNRNVIRLVEKKPWEFDARANYSEEELAAEVKASDTIPEYLRTFLDARRESRALFPDLSAEDVLAWLFYDEMAGHGNEFVREWFEFDVDLRNFLAGLNARRAGGPALSRVVVGRNEVAERILRSAAPDFGLGAACRWAERVLALESQGPPEREKQIDLIRWDALDELTILSHFAVETVLAFVVKLSIVDRWRRLDRESGKAMLQRLTDDLVGGFRQEAA
jgi:hypothetical protein